MTNKTASDGNGREGRGRIEHFGPKSPKWADVTEMWAEVTWSEMAIGKIASTYINLPINYVCKHI